MKIQWLAKIKKIQLDYNDAATVAGFACCTYGLATIYEPLGYLFCGAILMRAGTRKA